MSEAYQLMDCGLDSVVYLRLLWLNLSIFTFISLCTVPTLVPLDWKDHRPDKTWSIETLSQASLNDLTIQKVKGKALYFHIILLYAITFIVFFLIWWSKHKANVAAPDLTYDSCWADARAISRLQGC